MIELLGRGNVEIGGGKRIAQAVFGDVDDSIILVRERDGFDFIPVVQHERKFAHVRKGWLRFGGSGLLGSRALRTWRGNRLLQNNDLRLLLLRLRLLFYRLGIAVCAPKRNETTRKSCRASRQLFRQRDILLGDGIDERLLSEVAIQRCEMRKVKTESWRAAIEKLIQIKRCCARENDAIRSVREDGNVGS